MNMNRCSYSGDHCNMVGPCSCGLYHTQNTSSSSSSTSFSMLFSSFDGYQGDFSPLTPPNSSSVDCTLSLGTPSTRLTHENEIRSSERRPSSCISNFCWDILQTKPSSNQHKTGRPTTTNSGGNAADPLLARRCANCDTTSTPLWRNGPRGPKSLCNACGIRFKKEERRASAAAATGGVVGGQGMVVESQHMINNSSWVHSQSSQQKMPSCYTPGTMGSEFRFIDDVDDRDSPFLSWRLNVTDRPGLVHDFTR